jgi:hypothetical protein
MGLLTEKTSHLVVLALVSRDGGETVKTAH